MTNCTCCRDCADRHSGCHARCERYKAWQALHEQERARYLAYHTRYAAYADAQVDAYCKATRTKPREV